MCDIAGGMIFISTLSLFSPVTLNCAQDAKKKANAVPFASESSGAIGAAEWNPVALRHADSLCMAVITTGKIPRANGIYLADRSAPGWEAFLGVDGAAAVEAYLPSSASCGVQL